MFECIKKAFETLLEKDEFREDNKMNFLDAEGELIDFDPLDTSIDKLRRKYTSLKSEWRRIEDKIKTGSGLKPAHQPKWYTALNGALSECHEELD